MGAMETHMVISSVRSNTPVGLPFGQTAQTTGPKGHRQYGNIAYRLENVKGIRNIIIVFNGLSAKA
jgi:hypothetical protein